MMTPSQLNLPAFLMNVPFSFSAQTPNNQWMEDAPEEERKVDRPKAMAQFFELYQYLAARAVVTILPTPRNCRLQDLVFTANLGFVPEHLVHERIVIVSRFTSPPRKGEADLGERFFRDMGYQVYRCPYPFEGEAELRYLYGNVYVGGYGMRSSRKAHEWMEAEFGMRIVKVEVRDPYCYHLDCSIFPLSGDQALVATYLLTRAELQEIASVITIIPADKDIAMMGGCNSVMFQNTWLNGTIIDDIPQGHQFYAPEKSKNESLRRIADQIGKDLRFFNLSEFQKGGACLSCLVMHLNRVGFEEGQLISQPADSPGAWGITGSQISEDNLAGVE